MEARPRVQCVHVIKCKPLARATYLVEKPYNLFHPVWQLTYLWPYALLFLMHASSRTLYNMPTHSVHDTWHAFLCMSQCACHCFVRFIRNALCSPNYIRVHRFCMHTYNVLLPIYALCVVTFQVLSHSLSCHFLSCPFLLILHYWFILARFKFILPCMPWWWPCIIYTLPLIYLAAADIYTLPLLACFEPPANDETPMHASLHISLISSA